MKYDPAKFNTTIEFDTILGNRQGPFKPDVRVKYYDFRRPDKFSKDQIRTVQIMHETFARLSTSTLSAALRALVHIRVDCVDQLTYEEFIRSIPNPTTLAIINMGPLKGSAVLEIDPSITFAVIDRLFGGKGETIKLARDLTDIECSVMENIVIRIMGNLREAWSTIIDLQPQLGQIETNPMFAQIVPPHEMIILVTFEVNIEGVTGRMNLCVPYLTIEPIISKLSAQYWYSSPRLNAKPVVSRDVSALKADARVYFEAAKISLAGTAALKKNSLVKLTDFSSAFLSVGDKTVLKLKVKKAKGRYELAVDEPAAGKKTAGAAAGLFSAGETGQRSADEEKFGALLQAPLEKIAREMKSALEQITGKIVEMKKRQDELADQIFDDAQDKEGGVAGAGLKKAGDGKPFAFMRSCETEHIANFIRLELPQTIALILSHLDPAKASEILSGFPEEAQAEIAGRIASMERISPEVLREVERVLEKKLSTVTSEDYSAAGGVESIVEILNVAERKVERNVVDRLEKSNPALAEQIKRKMFVFEDTLLLDDKVIQLLLKRVDPNDLFLALKAVNEKVKEKFLKSMNPEAQKKFGEDSQAIGPVRLVDADKAQQRIIGIIRRLEEAGEIIVAHPDDLTVQ